MELDHSQLLGFKLPTRQVTAAKVGEVGTPSPDPKLALRLDPVTPQDAE